MTDYPLDMQLVVDPLNPENVVRGGSIYFYDPSDTAGVSPIAIKDANGQPLQNPLTANAYGFIPPTIVTIPAVKWKSGSFEGFFYSYTGLRNEAIAAKDAAVAAQGAASTAAGSAVTTAAVDGSGALVLTKANGATVNAGNVTGAQGIKGDTGAPGPNTVPTDTAIAAAVNGAGTATAGAIDAKVTSATAPKANAADVIPKWKTATAYTAGQQVISPNGDVVSAIANHTSGGTFTPANWNLSPTYAPFPGASKHKLTGYFYPEGFGTVTYGKGITSAQAQANAAAVQAAIDAANNGGGVAANTTGGGTVIIRDVIECYTLGAVSALTIYSGVHLRGLGPGGNVFSGTDANLPFRGSVLRLWGGANQDLIRSANFAALTGVTPSPAYSTPNRFGIYHLVLDGNKAVNTSGDVLKIYGASFWLDTLVIQNGAGKGLYTEYGANAGYDNEAQISNMRITDNVSDGWVFKGPHDTLVTNVFSARNGGSGFVTAGTVGSLTVTNMHNWGNAAYNFDLGTTDASFVNCVCDGTGNGGVGMRITAGNQRWIGGSIYGTNIQGETLVQLGDGANAVTIGGLDFHTRWWNLAMGSVMIGYFANVSLLYNVWRGAVNNNTNSRTTAGGLKAKVVGAQTLPVSTLNVVSTAGFPASGSLYFTTGTGSYTGITATSFTGVSGMPAGTQADGSFVTQSTPISIGGETYELRSSEGSPSVNMQVGGHSAAVISETVGRDQIGSLIVRSVATVRQTVASAGAVTIDAAKGNGSIITLQANATSSSIINPTQNEELTVTVLQDATGGRTFAWPSNCSFAGGAAPTDTTASKRTTVRFWYDPNYSRWYETARSVAVG